MKATIRIILLISLLAGFVFLGILSSAQQIPTAKVNSTTEDLPLFLDGKPVGSMSNVQTLESQFRSLQAKLDNANMADGSLPNIGRAVFVPEHRLSMSSFAQLWDKIGEFFDYPVSSRMALFDGQPCDEHFGGPAKSPAPSFVLSNSQFSVGEVAKIKSQENCWVEIQVISLGPQPGPPNRLLKSYRTAVTSMEITDTGAYLLNEQVRDARLRASPMANLENPALRRRVDSAPLTQRPVDPTALEKAVSSWVERRVAEGSSGVLEDAGLVELPIIVAGQTSYGALEQILKFVPKQKVKLIIVVNNIAPPGAVNQK